MTGDFIHLPGFALIVELLLANFLSRLRLQPIYIIRNHLNAVWFVWSQNYSIFITFSISMANDTLPPLPLPSGVSDNQVDCISTCSLSFHILEAGYDNARSNPLILLIHGFPELAFSWRKVMPKLASAGYYVVAVDQRGYGRTTGWDTSSFNNTDLRQFTMTQLVRDMLALINALGYTAVKCVVGHDFGAVSAAMCALTRPDVFQSCVMMSHPFQGSPTLPFNTAQQPQHNPRSLQPDVHADLANLPEPRKHYKWYNSTPSAATDWARPTQGLHAFLRGYIHLKSAAWAPNNPYPLTSFTATELSKLPYYYIMPLHLSMPATVAACLSHATRADLAATTSWLPDTDLAIYVQEWQRTGFQGGLNWYRSTTDPENMKDVQLFAGKQIEVPTVFISGEKDWGNYQEPGAIEGYERTCADFRGRRFIEGAGHWPQQEKPERVVEEILGFLEDL